MDGAAILVENEQAAKVAEEFHRSRWYVWRKWLKRFAQSDLDYKTNPGLVNRPPEVSEESFTKIKRENGI